MACEFKVIGHRDGGKLDAFKNELGRLRASRHVLDERVGRMRMIGDTIGFGHIIRTCFAVASDGAREWHQTHYITDTGVVLVFDTGRRKLVTVFIASASRIERYYGQTGEKAPEWLLERARRNSRLRHLG